MATTTLIAACVSADTKARFRTLAQRNELSESAFLKRLIDSALQSAGLMVGASVQPLPRMARGARLCIRLRMEDQRLLRERSTCRMMLPATYVAVLVRAHLRELAPLPKEELLALKRCVAELGAIGRNLNQLVQIANRDGTASGARLGELQTVLKVCMGLRDYVKALIKANTESWEQGHA